MKLQTLEKYLNILKKVKESGLSLTRYCKNNGINVRTLRQVVYNIKKDTQERIEIAEQIVDLYEELIAGADETLSLEEVETDDRAETFYERDEEGKIKYYRYEIYKKDKSPLSGRITREEMATIYRLYSYYGDSLTRRAISRHFPDLSLVDFKRILRAFNIFKDSSPFPPHYFEEYSEEELRDIQLREKENSFLRKTEEDNIKNTEKLLKKYAQENIELKRKLSCIENIEFEYPEIEAVNIPTMQVSGQDINLYLADMHIGSTTVSDSLYPENINYGISEVKRRLTVVLSKLSSLGGFDTLNLVLLGDQIDCCGFFGKTASMTHDMPENMQPRDQANAYIEVVMWFINNLVENNIAQNIRVFSVPEGNHSGNFEYVCNKAIMAMINARWPQIQTTLWEKYYGVFTQNEKTFVCCHGKAANFHKKGMPLNLDEKTKVLLYEWLDAHSIYGTDIHIIKGDLHSNNMNSCSKFTYRNVLSLYGASDYSSMNYSRNAYGVSYDLLIKDNVISGTFENL